MAPRPGDPPKAPSALPTSIKAEGSSAPELEVLRHTRALVELDGSNFLTDNKAVDNAVIFWKTKADRLRSAGIPLFVNSKNCRGLDPVLLAEAKQLDAFLDELITTESVLTDFLYRKLHVLIAGGEPLDVFQQRIKTLDYSLKCNVIWENDSVAYRCNTCALTPCMSLCAECFLMNGHEGHDFTRFFSREGGACDCGNADVLKEEGFCPRHGENAKKPDGPVPRVSLAEYIYMKLLVHFFLQLRGFVVRYNEENGESPVPTVDLSEFCDDHKLRYNFLIAFLQECVSLGGPMREAMSRVLLDEDLYKALTEENADDVIHEAGGKVLISLDWRTRRLFEQDVTSLEQSRCRELFDLPEFVEFLKCSNLLQELLIYIFRLNFPQSVINFSLSMLSEPPYLDGLSKSFFKWYPVVASSMRSLCLHYTDHPHPEVISQAGSRIIHISVQMLSSAALCSKLDVEMDLVQTVFRSSLFLLTEITNNTDISLDPAGKYVLNASAAQNYRHPHYPWAVITLDGNVVISQHGYWFVMGDIQNLMSHIDVALATLRREAYRITYMQLVSSMQGMCVNWRIVSGDHQMHDISDIAHRSFTLEYETLAITMFNFVAAVQFKEDALGACFFFDGAVKALEKWLQAVNGPVTGDIRSCAAFSFTYHLPLHRHVSVALTHFDRFALFRSHTQDFRSNEKLLRRIVLHPMRIQSARAEYNAQMWVRNGANLRLQSVIYAQPHINMSFLTPDVDLIRYCAAYVDPDWFISAVVECFHLDDVFQIEPFSEDVEMEEDESKGAAEETKKKPKTVSFQEYMRSMLNVHGVLPAHDQPSTSGTTEKATTSTESTTATENTTSTENTTATKKAEKSGGGDSEAVKDSETIEIPGFVEERMKAILDGDMGAMLEEGMTEEDVAEHCKKIFSTPAFRRVVNTLYEAQKRTLTTDDCARDFGADPRCRLRVVWKGEEESKVVTRLEWIHHLLYGSLLMLAELAVVRVNSGLSDAESLRGEMVHELTLQPLTFSQLRGSMAEKGSRGGSMVDMHFEQILGVIADFHEPDRASGRMEQGTYSLKKEVWLSDFCPVMCQMRSSLPQKSQEILRNMENIDKADLPADQQRTPAEPLWIPYRLYPIDDSRFCGLSNVPKILFSDRFFQLAIEILTYRDKMKDTNLQLLIYLLTVGAHWAAQLRPHQRSEAFARFFTNYEIEIDVQSEPNSTTSETIKRSLFHEIYFWFNVEVDRKGNKVEMMEKIFRGELQKERIVGGVIEYLGRLLSIVADNHDMTHILLTADTNLSKRDVATTPSKEASETEARKLASKKRREALMAAAQKKQQELMKKHMVKEGLTQSDVDRMDISNRKVRLFECPMCGVPESPSTVSAPFGMMIKLWSNNLSGMRVDADYEQPSLFDAAGSHVELPMRKKAWDRLMDKDNRSFNLGVYQDLVLGPQLDTEVKTCGHTAHIECFNAYRQAQHQHELRVTDTSKLPVACPMCRMMVDYVIPMRFDADIALGSPETFDTPQKMFEAIKNSVIVREKHYDNPQMMSHYEDHYNKFTEDWMARMNASDREAMRHHDRQTNLTALVRTTVERNLILMGLGVPERRRENDRSMAIEHLIPAIVYHTTKRSEEICLAAARDLFIPEVVKNSRPSTPRRDTRSSSPKKSALVDPDEEMLAILESTPRPSSSPIQGKIDQLLSDRSAVPLLMFDMPLLFVRISSFILSNDKLTPVEQKTLLGALTSRVLWAAAVKCGLLLMYRLTPQLAKELVNGKEEEATAPESVRLMAMLGQWYKARPSTFEALLSHLSDDEYSLRSREKVYSTLKTTVESLEKFCREFIYSSMLYERTETIAIPKEDISDLGACFTNWLQFYTITISWTPNASTSVIHRIPLTWRPRTLLRPPAEYDTLFSKFFRKKCATCDQIPSYPLMCMLCGGLACLDDCCNSHESNHLISEAERHSLTCAGPSCVFLALNNALVVVTTGAAGAIWGSIYLDAHGEEDRNLRRGKPLFLAEKRWAGLMADWAEQEWARAHPFVSITPSLLKDLKDAHYLFR